MSHSTEHLALDATTAPDAAVISTSHAPYEHDVITTPCAEPSPLLDDGAPEEIRARFGLSKKAFKRAVGGLLKQGAVRIEADGRIVLVAASSSSPPRVR